MLKLVEVDSFYGRSHVLHGVNLDVPAGEITTILGRKQDHAAQDHHGPDRPDQRRDQV